MNEDTAWKTKVSSCVALKGENDWLTLSLCLTDFIISTIDPDISGEFNRRNWLGVAC